MSDFPANNAFSVPATKTDLLDTDAADLFNSFLLATKTLLGADVPEELTISSGKITPTNSCAIVDTEGMSSLDLLTQITLTNIRDGQIIALFPKSESRVIKIVPNTGGNGKIILLSNESYYLNKLGKGVLLQRRGNYMYEVVFRASSLYSQTSGVTKFSSSGTFSVPENITKLYVSAIGGGGGGGGGAASGESAYGEANLVGGAGVAGGDTTIGTYLTAHGGSGGVGAYNNGNGGSGQESIGAADGRGARLVAATGSTFTARAGAGGMAPYTAFGTYGKGGNGGAGDGTSTYAGGGGGSGAPGQLYVEYEISVTPFESISITIGAGGAGGAGGSGGHNPGADGSSGNNGYVVIRY